MLQTISKSQFKPRVLEYLRWVERQKKPIVVTHGGKPVVQIEPFSENPEKILQELRGTVVRYLSPYEPVGLKDWAALQ